MSRGPGIREIFSHKSVRKNDAFQFDNQESKQQLKLSKTNDNDVAPSAMKKYGGYKPKILAGASDFLEVETYPGLDNTSPEARSPNQLSPTSQPLAVISKPVTTTQPWVIGDKNIPMVLGVISDNDVEEDNNNNTDVIVEDLINRNHTTENGTYNTTQNGTYNTTTDNDQNEPQRKLSNSSEASTLVSQSSDDPKQASGHPANGFVLTDGSDYTAAASTASNFVDYNTHPVPPDSQDENDLDGVYIPAPDYEEDEKTLDFNSEDTDDPSDGGDDVQPRKSKVKSAIKVYEGADLSHFLMEDEPEQEVVMRNGTKGRGTLSRNVKSEVVNSKGNQKQTLYKQQSHNKTKRKSKDNVPTFSSVRSFSYADSKFGAKEKTMGKSVSSPNLADDGDIFLNSHNQQSSYESFLKSRHGDDLPPDRSPGEGSNTDFRQSTKFKDDPMWKKLTLRLKRRISKSIGGKEQ